MTFNKETGNLSKTLLIENNLREHFAVLDELAQKFDDYTAIPTIPGEH